MYKRILFSLAFICLAGVPSGGSAASHDWVDPRTIDYSYHVIPVDPFGSALGIKVVWDKDSGGKLRFHNVLSQLVTENTNDSSVPSCFHRKEFHAVLLGNTKGEILAPKGPEVAARPGLFENYRRLRRLYDTSNHKEGVCQVMIYIHGGMNFIAKTGPFDGSTEKAVALTPLLLREHIYPIFICWNSNLFDTYRENLLFVREGLRQTGRGLATAPFQLVADFGGAAARAPLALSKLFFNDLYYLNPEGTRRRRIADARYDAMYQAGLSPDYTGVQTSVGADQRGTGRKAQDFLSWLAWLPNKAAVTPIIDGLGSPAWHNMLRRTRVMLDRESSFVQLLPAAERDACPAPGGVLKAQKQLAWSGREGAVRFFFESARDQLPAAGPLQPYYPRVTLIGHSMGAIIASDILTRVPDIHYENVVFMAAASSVNDFKLKVVPYLQNQQRKGSPTKFYNLCLNDANESGEREPSDFLEIAPRGSLLIWIDSLFDNPRDEDDRMLGRWENAILATDYVPDSIAKNVTIKAFGRDRHGSGPGYGLPARNAQGELEEPRKHGEFSRNQPTLAAGGAISDDGTPGNPNYPFWLEKYWKVEPESAAGDVLYHPKAGSRGR